MIKSVNPRVPVYSTQIIMYSIYQFIFERGKYQLHKRNLVVWQKHALIDTNDYINVGTKIWGPLT